MEVMRMSGVEKVVVRRRWDDPRAAEVPLDSLWDLFIRSEPGGVCGALPRSFLYGRVWCDKVSAATLGHSCVAESRPHELLVCVLPTDNLAEFYQRLRVRARG